MRRILTCWADSLTGEAGFILVFVERLEDDLRAVSKRCG